MALLRQKTAQRMRCCHGDAVVMLLSYWLPLDLVSMLAFRPMNESHERLMV